MNEMSLTLEQFSFTYTSIGADRYNGYIEQFITEQFNTHITVMLAQSIPKVISPITSKF